MRAAKEVMTMSSGRSLDEAFVVESRVAGRVMKSSDAVEGPRAFIEKRQPRFTGA